MESSINIWGSRDGVTSGVKYKQVPTEAKEVDYTPLYNYIDNKNFLSIKDNNIDAKGSRIKNLNDPENNSDAVHKEYCDNNKLTKNHVGYIPYNYVDYGFNISAKIAVRPTSGIDFRVSLLSKVDIISIRKNMLNLSILITCPYPVKIWKLFFKCDIKDISFLPFFLIVSGSNTNSRLNNDDLVGWDYAIDSIINNGWVDFYWQFVDNVRDPPTVVFLNPLPNTRRYFLNQNHTYERIGGIKYFNILTSDQTSFKYYKISLSTFANTDHDAVSIEDIAIILSNFQLYVYND